MGCEMVAAYASNDGYARHLAASMCSRFDQNQSEETIEFIVVSMPKSHGDKENLI